MGNRRFTTYTASKTRKEKINKTAAIVWAWPYSMASTCSKIVVERTRVCPGIDPPTINTTPNSVHRETTVAAAKAGKHTFLDKPIANSIDDARALTDACRKAKVVLALGYQRRR